MKSMSIKTYKKSILWVNRPILLQIQMLRITDLLTKMIPIMSLHKWITYTIKTIKLKISRRINQSRNERWYYDHICYHGDLKEIQRTAESYRGIEEPRKNKEEKKCEGQ